MEKSFYTTRHAPYYVCALDYIQQSAGIRVLHYLCHALNEIGMEAYVTCEVTRPELRTPILTSEVLQHHHATGRKPIVVYPEIISGDPLAAGGLVVRWLLNKPGVIGGDTEFHPDEMIFAYDPAYAPSGMHAELLHIPFCDTSIFNNENNPDDDRRDLTCFYAHKYLHKGQNGKTSEHVLGATSLCKDQKLTHAEIANILRRAKLLYVYEPTALITEALLCGCPVCIIVTDYWQINMAGRTYPPNSGIVMDDKPESLAMAREGVKNFQARYERDVVAPGWPNLDRFVELTQTAAKTLIKR